MNAGLALDLLADMYNNYGLLVGPVISNVFDKELAKLPVTVRAGELEWTVEVLALSARRGPASEAAVLYVEREESRTKRELMLAARRSGPRPDPNVRGRPTKRDRRLIHRFVSGD